MADGKVTIKAIFDGKQAEGEVSKLKSVLGGLGNAGSKVGSIFKQVLGANLVSSAVISGVNALTGAVKGAFESTISEGAKLQQSLGGVETLFKQNADTVKNYAQKAFETAGVSANEYMENVTSFSASLISSLGGDTAKAAELANTAMIDMSDNANKMGTDMQSITQTYQSLARGNYAMLDNLKLGYGGTKSEMERLMKDAEKLTGEHYTVGDFADTVKAIHAVQESLGITGTTAKEASSTLSGSFASMKAAWTDFKGNLADGELDITPSLQGLAKTTSTFLFGNFIPMITNVFSKLPQVFSTLMDAMGEEIQKGLKKILPNLDVDVVGAFKNIKSAVKMAFNPVFINNFKSALSSVGDVISSIWSAFTSVTSGGFAWTLTLTNVISALLSTIKSGAKIVKSFIDSFAATGAIQQVKYAIDKVILAYMALVDSIGDVSIWSTLGTAIGSIVNVIARVVQAIAGFISQLDPAIIKGFTNVIVGGIAALVAYSKGTKILSAGVKGLNFIKGFNPFALFAKNADSAMGGATKSVSRSKGLISQIFTGLANVIKSTGQAINNILKGVGVAAKGLGQGLAAAFKGIGSALKMLNPAQIISFGAAVGVAAIGIGAGIAIIAAGFTLLATQSQGIVTIIQAVSVGFGTFASLLIGAVANAIVTVSAVLPTIAQSMVILTPVIYAVASAFRSILEVLPPVITAFGTAISSIITAITPIVSIIASTFESVVQIVADAIVRIVQALAPFIPEVTKIVQTLAPVIQSIIDSFNNLVNQISPILDSLTKLIKEFGTQVKNILDGVSDVVESVGGVIERALQGVAGIFDSIGKAALNAGKGFKQFAQGVKILVDLKLGDLIGTLTATAKGVSDIAASAEGLASAGRGMQQFGQGMMLIQTAGTVISTVLTSLANSIPIVVNSITMLGPAMITASASMTMFATSVTTMATSMTGVVANFLMFSAGLVSVQSSIMMIVSSFTMLNAIIAVLGGVIGTIPGQFNAISASASGALNTIRQLVSTAASVSAGFANLGSTASSAMNALSSSVKSAVSQSISVTKSGMQAMTSAIQSASSKMIQIATQTGQNVASKLSQGIRSGSGQAKSAMSSLMSAVRSAGVSGASQMTYVGRMIGEGVATGMRQALGSVTAAANAIIEQANRAAQAKAQIHSPSRLFAKTVGQFIPAGVGMGIENNIGSATDSIKLMIDKMSSYQFNPEDILTGNGSFTRRVALKASGERLISYDDESRNNQEKWSQKVLDAIDNVANRPTYVVLDDGTLVGKIVDPITDLQSQKDKIKRAVWGLGFE
ncbi:tape measure protein [Enterococcus cecorum]|uniref:tape measure protein n=1 Tax=Enterococcus cecorum TaxID=44008 RepID=UPI001FAC7D3E|nr:tape measure protein [Enterococcus cecorum]MCJ0552243.1 tape measure protein [Enterococcus cecorum]MCJ0557801.1 tape measure protein [Enterococcus cecorum]MCJ0562602.1 tape measure protein [Enterococcus cecorum]